MTTEAARLRIKTLDLRRGRGLQQRLRQLLPEAAACRRGSCFATPLAYITVLFQPWVALGVSLLILWMLSRMALLSWADLSYVLPVTSIGYVLVALAGRILPARADLGAALGRDRADHGGRGAGRRRHGAPVRARCAERAK